MKQEARNFGKKMMISTCCCLFFLSTTQVFADSTDISPQQPLRSKPVEYTLPYPGLLPDHPLYFFRAVRDTMQDIFTSDPLKKAEFHLLQADKRVSASVLLAEKNDTLQLGGATAIESQAHFEKALEALENAKEQGLEINDLSKKLMLANEKHQETLTLLAQGAEEYTEEYTKAATKARDFSKKAKSFLATK